MESQFNLIDYIIGSNIQTSIVTLLIMAALIAGCGSTPATEAPASAPETETETEAAEISKVCLEEVIRAV